MTDTTNPIEHAREVLDRAASDLGDLLALELPLALHAPLVAALRAVAGVEAIADALATLPMGSGEPIYYAAFRWDGKGPPQRVPLAEVPDEADPELVELPPEAGLPPAS